MRARLAAAAAYIKASPAERAGLQQRAGLMLDVIPPPWSVESSGGWGGSSDPSVLPAASAAMRLIANDVSVLPLVVYREVGEKANAEKARDSWQWDLLHQAPAPGVPACVFWFNVTMGIIARGNSHAFKWMSGSQVAALEYMDGKVAARDERGARVYDWYRPADQTIIRGIPASRVLHFRGPNFDGGVDGKSILELHRTAFETGIVQDVHQRATYANGAQPKIAFGTTERLGEEQADEWIERFEARHKGARNAGRPMILPSGTEIKMISIAPEDAQFLEQRQYNVADIERVFLLPPGTLQEPATRPPTDADAARRYLRQTLLPLTTLIEQTLEADPDLFGGDGSLYPAFLTAAMTRADVTARYEAYLKGRQAGWLSVNDIRAMEDLPPIPDGDQYQTTPVGGAPNLQPTQQEPSPNEAA